MSVKSKFPVRLPPNKSRFFSYSTIKTLCSVFVSPAWARGRKITTPPKNGKWQIDEKPNGSPDAALVFLHNIKNSHTFQEEGSGSLAGTTVSCRNDSLVSS